MSAPLVVNTKDGTCWTRRAVTRDGLALYAPADVCRCPEFVVATQAELAEHGIVGSADALPMPVGPEPSLLSTRTRELVEMEADRNRWKAEAETLRERLAEYERPVDEDPIAYTLTEQADGITRRIAPVQALREEAAAEQPVTVFRASHDSIVMGLYTTAAAAREHCETLIRRDIPGASLDWIEDDVAELVASFGEDERATGYVVTALEVAAAYDEEADE